MPSFLGGNSVPGIGFGNFVVRLEAMPQTVFVGSHFFPRLEESAEVAGIVETEFVGNFRNIQVGIDK